MFLKNFLLKIFIKFFGLFIKKNASNNPQRILVVTTTGLGDTLWATPAIESLRKSFPQSYVAVLTSPLGAQVLQYNPDVLKIYILKKFSYSLWKSLYREKFDTILLFHASQRLTLPLLSLLGAQKIIGTSKINKGLDSLLTDPIEPIREHEIERRLRIVEKSGGQSTTKNLSFFLQANEKLQKKSNIWIAIHPGSKDIFKRWPAQNFSELGRELKKKLGCEILITGAAQEKALMQQVAQEIPGAHVANWDLSLRPFAAVLDQMNLLICNDTGPFHLACALNKPVVGIYSSTDPFLCGAHAAAYGVVISKKASCEPCLKRKCRSPFCFLQIGTNEVLQASLKLLMDSV